MNTWSSAAKKSHSILTCWWVFELITEQQVCFLTELEPGEAKNIILGVLSRGYLQKKKFFAT